MTKLIGITGRSGSGKDTFARGLIDAGYRHAAFANSLKTLTAFLAGEPTRLYHDVVAKEQHCEALGMTRRRALQDVGAALRSALGPDIWCRYALRTWDAEGQPPAVITDVRYDNEADAILSLGGVIVEIVRPDNVGLTGEAAAHESERGVSGDRINFRIFNTGTIEELQLDAVELLEVLSRRPVPEGAAAPDGAPMEASD